MEGDILKIPSYVLSISNQGTRSGILLYNTLTGGKMLISDEKYQLIHPSSYSKTISNLYEKGYIVNDAFDEKKYVHEMLSKTSSSYNLTIVSTFDCNMCCEYCFEKHIYNRESFSPKQIETILDRVKSRIVNDGKTSINIAFTGGEPLLNYDFLQKFCEAFEEEIACKYNVSYSFGLITNGTLLNQDIICFLSKHKFKSIQVTLDGTMDSHNLSRPMKSHCDSHSIIIENINKYMEQVPFAVRTNYKPGEEDELYKFIDDLCSQLKNLKYVKLKIRNVMNTVENSSYNCNYNYKKIGQIIAYAHAKGIDILQGSVCDTCRIHSDSNEYIIPNGDIYRCYMFVEYKEFKVENIYTEDNSSMTTYFNNLRVWEECLHCPIVALCAGGCRYEAYVNKHDIARRLCDYHNKSNLIKRFIQVKYQI